LLAESAEVEVVADERVGQVAEENDHAGQCDARSHGGKDAQQDEDFVETGGETKLRRKRKACINYIFLASIIHESSETLDRFVCTLYIAVVDVAVA